MTMEHVERHRQTPTTIGPIKTLVTTTRTIHKRLTTIEPYEINNPEKVDGPA